MKKWGTRGGGKGQGQKGEAEEEKGQKEKNSGRGRMQGENYMRGGSYSVNWISVIILCVHVGRAYITGPGFFKA